MVSNGKETHFLTIAKKRKDRFRYRDIKDNDMYEKKDEKYCLLEFSASGQNTSEILSLVEKMNTRRNAVTERMVDN